MRHTGDLYYTSFHLLFPDDSIDETTHLREKVDHSENTVVSSELKHFSHDHHLLRFDLQINDALCFTSKQCDALAKPISSTYYSGTQMQILSQKMLCRGLPQMYRVQIQS